MRALHFWPWLRQLEYFIVGCFPTVQAHMQSRANSFAFAEAIRMFHCKFFPIVWAHMLGWTNSLALAQALRIPPSRFFLLYYVSPLTYLSSRTALARMSCNFWGCLPSTLCHHQLKCPVALLLAEHLIMFLGAA